MFDDGGKSKPGLVAIVGKIVALAFLQLVILVTGPETLAQAQQVTCSTGGTTSNFIYITINIDAKTCANSMSNPSNPQNGLELIIDPQAQQFRIIANYYENGAPAGGQNGTLWNISNYSNLISTSSNGVQFLDTIPTTGMSSDISTTFVINGVNYPFLISDATKTDMVDSVTFGTVTVTFPTPTVGPSAQTKSNIVNHLFSVFSQVDNGIFGPGGVPVDIADSTEKETGAGFSILPNVLPSGLPNKNLPVSKILNNLLTPVSASPNRAAVDFGASSSRYQLAQNAQGAANTGVNFSFNLKHLLANQQKQQKQEGLEHLSYSGFSGVTSSPWNIWANGRYTDFNDKSSNADRGGHIWATTGGLTYQLNDNITLGSFGRLRFGKASSKALDAKLKSNFYGGGVFVSSHFDNGIRVMAGGLFEAGDNKISIAGASGKFNSKQYTIDGRIDNRFATDETDGRSYWIEPMVDILYSDIRRGGYRDSANVSVSSSNLNLGRLTFGPTIGATFKDENAVIKPFLRLNGRWDFISHKGFSLPSTTTFDVFGNPTVVAGAKISAPDHALLLGGGVEVTLKNGLWMKVTGDWVNFNTRLESLSVSGSIGLPLSVFGGSDNALSAGLLSMDFASNASSASTKLRLSIPLHK